MDVREDFKNKQKRYLREHPICVRCGRKASEVHHITPIIFGGTNDDVNLASLCSSCHKEWDIWEAGWVGKYGAVEFEHLFNIFCFSPSTAVIAAVLIYVGCADSEIITSDPIIADIDRVLKTLSALEFEFNNLEVYT